MKAIEPMGLPYFRRSHGAFNQSHEAAIGRFVSLVEPHGVFDPFLGRGRSLYSSKSGRAPVYGCELLPAVVLLGYLDRPELRADPISVHRAAIDVLENARGQDEPSTPGQFVPDWITAGQTDFLAAFAQSVSLPPLSQPWKATEVDPGLAAAAALVCAARLYTAWRKTKNAVWYIAGGVPEVHSPIQAAKAFLDCWLAYQKRPGEAPLLPTSSHVICADTRAQPLPVLPSEVDTIITSPPYANGHNYARQWAPECAVSTALGYPAPGGEQLGVSTRDSRPTNQDLETLPFGTQAVLEAIRLSDVKDSATYYHRRFASYALGMRDSLLNIDAALDGREASLLFIVRDTRHGDVLFRVGELIADIGQPLGWELSASDTDLIRSHIGNKRRAVARVVGNVQFEHTLHLTKVGHR